MEKSWTVFAIGTTGSGTAEPEYAVHGTLQAYRVGTCDVPATAWSIVVPVADSCRMPLLSVRTRFDEALRYSFHADKGVFFTVSQTAIARILSSSARGRKNKRYLPVCTSGQVWRRLSMAGGLRL